MKNQTNIYKNQINYMRKKIKKQKNIIKLLLILIVLGFLTIIVKNFYNKEIVKDIMFKELSEEEFQYEPQDNNIAWSSELPEVIINDMKYAEENDIRYICYFLKGISLFLRYDDNNWSAITLDAERGYLNYENEGLTNFSIYKSNGMIVLYGYKDNFFIREQNGKREILTYDINLPLNFHSIHTFVIGKYTVGYESGNFYWYQKGILQKKISINEELGKNVEVIQFWEDPSIFITADNELYYILVWSENNQPCMKFQYVGTVDKESVQITCVSAKNEGISLKLINDKYLIVPKNLDLKIFLDLSLTWNKKSSLLEKPSDIDLTELKLEMVNLLDCFFSCTFIYQPEFMDYTPWIVEWKYVVKDIVFSQTKTFNGFDRTIEIPDEVAEKYAITVKTVSQYWDTVEAIRKEYSKYYEHYKE